MTMARVRSTLFIMFLASLALQVIAFFFVRYKMWPEDFQALILRILTIYSVPLAVVLGGIAAQPRDGLAAAPLLPGWAAIVLTALWNLLLIGRSLGFVLAEQDSVASAVSYLDAVASSSSFLVAGVITAFFAVRQDR
jgi:hypothetical protein